MDGRHRPNDHVGRAGVFPLRAGIVAVLCLAAVSAVGAGFTHHRGITAPLEQLSWIALGAFGTTAAGLILRARRIRRSHSHLIGRVPTGAGRLHPRTSQPAAQTLPAAPADPVTGMAGRQYFSEALTDELSSGPLPPGARRRRHVVMLCDVDDFKFVNETLGHRIGDQILAVLGARILATVRTADTAARLGDDEFAVLMRDTDLVSATLVAQRLQAKFAEPVVVEGRTLTIAASIGLAEIAPGEVTSEEALRNADLALYLAKERGKAGIACYESRLHTEAVERMLLTADLRRALDRDEFVLHYQPTVNLQSHSVVGFEALVRWQHPDRGMLAPGAFIGLAEESDLIVGLGQWVLETACRVAAAMQSATRQPIMSVNVAARQLAQPDFVDKVTKVLTDTGLPSDRLCLEITESVVLTDVATVTSRLLALRERGIRIAIDDFGTGYSSLSYLSQLPVDVLKVDKSFVDRVMLDEHDATLTMAIIALGRTMNLTTVAEGVEDQDQASWLAKANCGYGQGYLWSRPVAVDSAHQLLGAEPFDEMALQS